MRTMSGSTPFPARSPTQTNHYPPYSPTHSNRPYYNHEYVQHPPPSHVMQTPPPFAPASIVHSPHHSRQPTLASPLPPPNSSLPPPPPSASNYQPLTSSPPYSLQRTYSGHVGPGSMPAPYETTPTSHTHPHSRSGSILQSPIREHHPIQNGVHHDNQGSDSRPQSKEVSRKTSQLS